MMVKNPKFKNYMNAFPEYKFLEGWNHHFLKWKPYIIYEHLKDMKEGDLLVYHDCDILKHREYEKGIPQFKSNVNSILQEKDLVCSMDTLYDTIQDSTKEEVFLSFGDFRDKKKLRTNRIFIRKNPKTLQFVYNWLTLSNTRLLLPNFNEKHSYSESLFNVLYYKYIEMGVWTHPTLYIRDNVFTEDNIFFLDKKKDIKERISRKEDVFLDTPLVVVPPVRRMLTPHQSTRSITMALIPIAKPLQPIVRPKPPSFFTLSKTSR
jgi:hypothetical protein